MQYEAWISQEGEMFTVLLREQHPHFPQQWCKRHTKTSSLKNVIRSRQTATGTLTSTASLSLAGWSHAHITRALSHSHTHSSIPDRSIYSHCFSTIPVDAGGFCRSSVPVAMMTMIRVDINMPRSREHTISFNISWSLHFYCSSLHRH